MSEDIEALRKRFWPKVQIAMPNECWPWIAGKNNRGYGLFKAQGRSWLAHRIAYVLGTGKEPGTKLVCHSCDNPCCCNPGHLWLGTDADNNADKGKKGRARAGRQDGTHNPRARLTEAEVRMIIGLFRDGQGNTEIAERFNISHATIGLIRNGKAWKEVADQEGWKPQTLKRGRARLSPITI